MTVKLFFILINVSSSFIINKNLKNKLTTIRSSIIYDDLPYENYNENYVQILTNKEAKEIIKIWSYYPNWRNEAMEQIEYAIINNDPYSVYIGYIPFYEKEYKYQEGYLYIFYGKYFKKKKYINFKYNKWYKMSI